MNIKRIKRICDVRGCRCMDSYAISLSREVGNSVIICRSCVEKALEAMQNAPEKEERPIRTVSIPPLFYHPEAATAVDEVVDETVAKTDKAVAEAVMETTDPVRQPEDAQDGGNAPDPEDEEEEADPGATAYVCEQCYRGFKTEKGLKTHMRHCKE